MPEEARVPRKSLMPVVAVALALAGCAEPPPPEFISKEDKFKAQFGGEPEVRGAGTKHTVYSARRDDGVSSPRAWPSCSRA